MASPANLTSHVAPLQATYLPGDVFKATWEVAYPATPTTDANVTLQDIKISVIGSEIIDPKWVAQSYHALQTAVHTSSRTSEALPASASQGAGMDAPVDTPPDALSAPSEPSASQAQSHQNSPMGRAAAARAQAGSFASGAPSVMSAAEAAGGMRDGAEANADGTAASVAGAEGGDTATNGQVKPGASRSGRNLQLPSAAAVVPTALAARMGLSRTSSSSTALAPTAKAAAAAAAPASGRTPAEPAGERRTAGAHSSQNSARASFRVGIAPAEALATVTEAESDAAGTPRGAPLNRTGSHAMATLGPGLGSGALSGPFQPLVPATFDAVQGPMIDFAMVSPEHAAPVATEVLPAFPIGAEHALWGSPPMATDGHRFLWAPNEADEGTVLASAAGSAALLTPGGGAVGGGGSGGGGALMHDLSIPDSADGGEGRLSALDGSMADGEGLAVDSAVAGEMASGSFGSGSPAYRHSEAGTPRVGHRGGPASDRGPADPRVFHLAFRGAALARIELHTSHEGPLFPGCTFSVTVDFRAVDGAARKRAACHQVVVVLETEEQVAREWVPAAVARRPGAANGIRRPYDEAQEASLHSLFSSFMFTVPRDAPAAFRTPLLALRWALRFEFAVVAPRAAAATPPGRWPPEEELLWRMPLPVAPIGSVPGVGFG